MRLWGFWRMGWVGREVNVSLSFEGRGSGEDCIHSLGMPWVGPLVRFKGTVESCALLSTWIHRVGG